jgi:hypothetical protein
MESEKATLVVACDIAGCPNELVVGESVGVRKAVEEHPGWACVGGVYVCAEHAKTRPWLS